MAKNISIVFGSNSAALCERYPLPTTTPSLVPNPINTLHTLYFFLQIHSPIPIAYPFSIFAIFIFSLV
ncbi:hypothetical protein P8452_21663 [Trifolium repens]|nr:hypothetical protein P8452_21663 [Trifolium repens]